MDWLNRQHATTLLPILTVALGSSTPGPADTPPAPDPRSGLVLQSANERPQQVELSVVVRRLLDDPLTGVEERRRLRIFHGQWQNLGDLSVAERAELALERGELVDQVLLDDAAPARLRANAALRRGEPLRAIELLMDDPAAAAALLRARAHEQLGQLAQAVNELQPWREKLETQTLEDPVELTAAARALVVLARLEGRPGHDYQLAIDLLSKVRHDLDPLYWPAPLAEAEILIDKDNRAEATEALLEALALNPVCSQAWYKLGLLAVDGYDFERAAYAAEKLRAINLTHPLAGLLEARCRLQQRDVAGARAIIEPAVTRFPAHRQFLALLAATEALAFDDAALQSTLNRFDQLAPAGSANPLAHHTVGAVLAAARQYDAGEVMLREAIGRQPNWPAPWIELGLLLIQAGRDEDAHHALAQAVRLDPFNRRANNQLKLVEELLSYQQIETEHFLIRFKGGIDEALARDMPDQLEKIYREITTAFEHWPARKTHIDIMPDERYFGVRITGMPEIWTIAASTGNVIALTPPRSGARQRGTYNWVNVVRHEFVHTVTLDQTRNRVPHWFAEACAVSQETTGRAYETCELLAWALHNDRLFELDEINWRFVRPASPRDRPLAYAQSDWMLQYIAETFGHRAIVQMLERFRHGMPDTEALQSVTGWAPDRFMAGFKAWGASQVEQWGLGSPLPGGLLDRTFEDSTAVVWGEKLPLLSTEDSENPELMRLTAQHSLADDDPEAARRAVLRYAAARPLDPWPHRALVQLALASGRSDEAIASLEQLDRQDNDSGRWAYQLARMHRDGGRLENAAAAIGRAMYREPYNATFRQLSATINLQRGEQQAALHQLQTMAILEPQRACHHVRLAALYHRMGRFDEARAAAERARERDPGAPVERFTKP